MDKTTHLLVRVGVAFAFLYPVVSAFMEPDSWIGYFPGFMRGIVPDPLLLHSFGLVEVVIALWILSGRRIFIPSVLASVMLVAIVAFNFNSMDVVFRDLSIACAALALATASRQKSHQ